MCALENSGQERQLPLPSPCSLIICYKESWGVTVGVEQLLLRGDGTEKVFKAFTPIAFVFYQDSGQLKVLKMCLEVLVVAARLIKCAWNLALLKLLYCEIPVEKLTCEWEILAQGQEWGRSR